jgi:hypothetical protein
MKGGDYTFLTPIRLELRVSARVAEVVGRDERRPPLDVVASRKTVLRTGEGECSEMLGIWLDRVGVFLGVARRLLGLVLPPVDLEDEID